MKLIDITRIVQEAPVYPGAAETKIERVTEISKGDNSNYSLITTNSHAGTHIDAFCHFVQDGLTTEQMNLSLYYGSCRVLSFPRHSILQASDFEDKLEGVKRVAIHGGGYTYLDASAAEYILARGIKTIVTDAWSVAPLNNEVQIHRIFLQNGVAIVENVILDGVADGDYILCAFPINYGGCDGAPVRAVLIDNQN